MYNCLILMYALLAYKGLYVYCFMGSVYVHMYVYLYSHPQMYECTYVGLSDSENFAITIVEIVIFTIMNTIMIVDLLNISIHKYQN